LTDDMLVAALRIAVPLMIADLTDHTSAPERKVMAADRAPFIHGSGDNMMFWGSETGNDARAFNHMALGIALGAFEPGGITAFGQHWEAP
jgi:hypothetical protein